MKFSINLDFVYENEDYAEAIREIKEIGFENIEICFMQNKSLEKLVEVQKETGIGVQLMLSYFVDLTDGDKEQEFIEQMKIKIEEAKALGCDRIIVAVGDNVLGISHEEQLKNIEKGCMDMIPMFEEADMIMLLEPINKKVDHPTTGLWSSKESFDMVRRINSPRIKILYDIYHMEVMEGDCTRTIIENMDIIDHLHCAGNPGRHEPYIGEINYPEIIRLIKEAGFDGNVGIEYSPTVSPKEGLTKLYEMFRPFMSETA